MDEDLLKRNTDCVYFLASPHTCKKGVDCEYRHSEMARLNPRDCWYWLSGNCFNPTCAFRHPPLDGHTGHTGAPSEPTHPSLPVNKKMVPCYFFFNGYCNKGDRCSFLHGPDDGTFAVKPVKNDSGSTDALIFESKTSAGNTTGVALTPSETHPTPYETASKGLLDFKFQAKKDLQQPVPKNAKQRSISLNNFDDEHKEATVTKSSSQNTAEGFFHNISHLCTEQSSEEQVNGQIEPSSPGFDVLVHDDLENLRYEDDPEYLLMLDREHRELNGRYVGYESKDAVEHDPMIPEADMYEGGMYDRYRHLDSDFALANDRKVPAYSREIILDSILSRKRIRMPAELAACDRNVDLREYLRRRKEINGQPVSGFLRRCESSCLTVQSQERHRRHGIDSRISGRLLPEVGLSTIASIGEGETLLIANNPNLSRHSQQHRSRKHYREKLDRRQFLSSEVSRKPDAMQRRFFDVSATFMGPKTLAEIKEEKKAQENGNFKTSSPDFQDPKPLSEILKNKRRLDCVTDGNSCND